MFLTERVLSVALYKMCCYQATANEMFDSIGSIMLPSVEDR